MNKKELEILIRATREEIYDLSYHLKDQISCDAESYISNLKEALNNLESYIQLYNSLNKESNPLLIKG